MKSTIQGLNNGYKKILEKVQSIQFEDMWHIGYGINDLPYHVQGERLEIEKKIHRDIELKINDLVELLKNSISE